MDRRIRRTRKLLSQALLSLVLEKSFDQITVQDITDEADLNRATFYKHFGSKEELLAVSLSAYFEELTKRIEAETSHEPIWESIYAIQLVFEHVEEHAALYKVLLGKQGLGYVINFIIEYTAVYNQTEIEASCDTKNMEIPVELVARHFAGSLYATLIWWLENDMPYTPKEMAEMGKTLCLNGTIPILAPHATV